MRFFSKPLMKQNIKANWVLALVILIIMCMMSTVINFAMSIMGSSKTTVDTDTQKKFYSYLFVIANYNTTMDDNLSYDNFMKSDDKSKYEVVFSQLGQKLGEDLSVEDFEENIAELSKSDVAIETYVKQFEYIYALQQQKGFFDGEDLTLEGMLNNTLEVMGVSPNLVENMGKMDMTSMLNQMYFTVIGLLPIFLFVVIMANSLVVDQVDSGSMAYILSTPTRRSSVVITQGIFLIVAPLIIISIVCGTRILSTFAIYGEANVSQILMLYFGMYLLVEAVTGICYLGSCVFNNSRKAMAFGGGITVWFFLASLLGMFGSHNLVSMGVGVEELGIFNKLTLVGLYDIKAIGTVGTSNVDYSFAWKLAVLASIAVVCYIVGAIRFTKKDLPL